MASKKKTNAKDLPSSLTDDKKVISSMKAIQRAGFWAFIIALFAPLLLIVSLAFGGEKNSSLYVLPILGLYLAYSGWRMNNLKGRKSIVLMLIINIILSCVMIVGIFPVFLLIMSLIALIRIRPYLKWSKGGTEKDEVMSYKQTARYSSSKHTVKILDPIRGELTEERTIDKETFEKYANKKGEIFAVRAYKEGKPNTRLVQEDIYKATYKAFDL
jgi:hypothetical protein